MSRSIRIFFQIDYIIHIYRVISRMVPIITSEYKHFAFYPATIMMSFHRQLHIYSGVLIWRQSTKLHGIYGEFCDYPSLDLFENSSETLSIFGHAEPTRFDCARKTYSFRGRKDFDEWSGQRSIIRKLVDLIKQKWVSPNCRSISSLEYIPANAFSSMSISWKFKAFVQLHHFHRALFNVGGVNDAWELLRCSSSITIEWLYSIVGSGVSYTSGICTMAFCAHPSCPVKTKS